MSRFVEDFKKLCESSIDDQTEVFLKSFIFALGDDWKNIVALTKAFRKYLKDLSEGREDLNPIQAADFLQKNGRERTALQRKQEVQDIDLDSNGRICMIEYLLLHYKAMILEEYFKRTGESHSYDLSNGAVGITNVGDKLLEQLFTPPLGGLPPELVKAIEEFSANQRAKNEKIRDLNDKAAQGGVKGRAAENELKQMESQDQTAMNRLEVTLNAAKRKAGKESGEVALQKKKKIEEDEAKKKAAESRAALKARAAAFEQQQQ
eukprot:m51a1_g5951 hypothetical protein (263) ;mRNA; f:138249-139458